jgi:hypothetical protein
MHERHLVSPSYESSDPLVNLLVAIRNECRAEREGDCDPSSRILAPRTTAHTSEPVSNDIGEEPT